MDAPTNTKSLRKRLQRQLEFYLSASNLRQDKFLQQHMDDQGFLPASLFLSFNKMKTLRATEKLVLEAAQKSDLIRVDDAHACVAPIESALAWQRDGSADDCTIYVEGFDVELHDHDSLRKVFAALGKVQLVSMPRFTQSRKFKGFAFIEFTSQEIAAKALAAMASLSTEDETLCKSRGMTKRQWLEMKDKLKVQLQRSIDAADPVDVEVEATVAQPSKERTDTRSRVTDTVSSTSTTNTTDSTSTAETHSGHVRFRDHDDDDDDDDDDEPTSSKRSRA